MNKRNLIILLLAVLTVTAVACQSQTVEVEVTRVVTETEEVTVEVTRVVTETVEVEGEMVEVTRVVEVPSEANMEPVTLKVMN